MDKDLRHGIILLIIGFVLGICGQTIAHVIFEKDPEVVKMEQRQKWPWQYTAGEPSNLFPREINDYERNEIYIFFQIPLEKYSDDLILFLNGCEIHGNDFLVNLSVKHANGNFVNVGTVKFDKQSEGLKRMITIPVDKVGPGANTFQLKSESQPYDNQWLFWDDLSLMTKDGYVIWEIGIKDNSKNEFHDLRFTYP